MSTTILRDKTTGSEITVEHEAGASPAQIKALAVTHMARGGVTMGVTAPPAAKAPDLVGRAKAALVKEPPAGTHTMFGETDMPGRVVRAAGEMFLPSSYGEAARLAATLPVGGSVITAPLKRIGVGSVAGAVADTASRGYSGALDFAKRLGVHGGEQALGEVLPGALNFGLTQRAARPALRARSAEAVAEREAVDVARTAKAREEHDAIAQRIRQGHAAIEETQGRHYQRAQGEDAARTREAKAEHQGNAQRIRQEHAAIEQARKTAFERAEAAKGAAHERATETAKVAHATAMREYESTGAAAIADSFKAQVPALQGFPSTEAGLVSMVSGKGPRLVSQAYDVVMKQIAGEAKGRAVELPLKDAQALGVRFFDTVELERGRPITKVDASQLAEAATGFWRKDHGVYRRAVAALDRLGIGDPEARAQYRAAQGLFEFAEASQMLKGQRFNPTAAMAAFDKVKKLDTLRRRGLGDIDTGVIADVARRPAPTLAVPGEPVAGTPPRPLGKPFIPPFRAPAATAVAPRPLAKPFVPPFRKPAPTPTPELPAGTTLRTTPKIGFFEGAAVAEIPFLLHGIAAGQYHGYFGVPGFLGGFAGRALSERSFATRAPLSPAGRFATRALPPLLSQEAASAVDRR